MSGLDSLRAQHYPKLSDCSPSNEKSVVEWIWNTKSPDLKADILQELFARMDLGNLLALCQIDKLSNEIASPFLSNKAKECFPDLASVVGLIPPSTIMARIEKIHKLAENCGCNLDLLEQEKTNPTIKGTRLLEEYPDHRSTLVVWQKLADIIDVDTKPDLSTLNSIEDFRNEVSQFSDWFNGHINQLINLQTLTLEENNLTSLPPEIGNLINLNHLYLTENNLTSLPPEIGNLINLRWLTLNKNNLGSLPPEIGQLIHLTSLCLDENKLVSLPPEIGNLIILERLTLNKNNLGSLPPEIGQLINLETLELEENNLVSLPPEIGQLINLETLELEENNLTSWPPEIGNLINLRQLNLAENNLVSLPPEIGNLFNLGSLYLRGNNLDSLPPEIGQLTALLYFDVADNHYLPYGYSLVFPYIPRWIRPYLLTPLFSIMQKF